MANSISKQKIVDYIDVLIGQCDDSMESYTSRKSKYYQIHQQQRAMLFSLRFNINGGMFDETEYNTYPNGAMIDKKITSNLEVSK